MNISLLFKIVAQAVESVAVAGAGIMSFLGWHQPKVPKRLSK